MSTTTVIVTNTAAVPAGGGDAELKETLYSSHFMWILSGRVPSRSEDSGTRNLDAKTLNPVRGDCVAPVSSVTGGR